MTMAAAVATTSGIRHRRRVACVPPMIPQNPYQRLLYAALGREGFEIVGDGRIDVGWLIRERNDVGTLHFHWPESCYRHRGRGASVLSWVKLALFGIRLSAARVLGYRIVWTVHQVLPHERAAPGLDRAAAVLLARMSDELIVHDAKTRDDLLRVVPGSARKLHTMPHGSYVGVYPVRRSRAEVREELRLGPQSFVFLAFGHIRAYKDIGLLLDAFSALENDDVALVVAGLVVDAETGERLARAAADDSRIRTVLGFIADEQVGDLYEAADAAVLPRGDGGTSGALVLALSQAVPVVAARTPTYVDLAEEDGAAWWFEPGQAVDLRRALESAAGDREAASRMRTNAAAAAARLRWDDAAAAIAPLLAPEVASR